MYPVRGIKKWLEFPLCKDSVISFWGKFRFNILSKTAQLESSGFFPFTTLQ